jgi:hypothetical protein
LLYFYANAILTVQVTFGNHFGTVIEAFKNLLVVLAPERKDLKKETIVTVQVSNIYQHIVETSPTKLQFKYIISEDHM